MWVAPLARMSTRAFIVGRGPTAMRPPATSTQLTSARARRAGVIRWPCMRARLCLNLFVVSACTSMTGEMRMTQPRLHDGGGEPLLGVYALAGTVTRGDRDDSVRWDEATLLTFGGMELATRGRLALRPGTGEREFLPVEAPVLPRVEVAATLRLDGGATGVAALMDSRAMDGFVADRLAWQPELGSRAPVMVPGLVVAVADGALMLIADQTQLPGGELVYPRGRVVSWSPDVGERWSYAPPTLGGPGPGCPDGAQVLSGGSGLRGAPGGRHAVVFGAGQVRCQGGPGSTPLDQAFAAVVLDTRTGAPLFEPYVVRAPKIEFAYKMLAAAADDGGVLMSVPLAEVEEGEEDRAHWRVLAPDGSEAAAFTTDPYQTPVEQVYAWPGGWLLRTPQQFLKVASDGVVNAEAAAPAADQAVVVTSDALYTLTVEVLDALSDFEPERYCLNRHDESLALVETKCLDRARVEAALVGG